MGARANGGRRRRGSTILYAVVLAGTGAALAVAGLEVASSARRLQNRREERTRLGYVGLSLAAQFQARALNPGFLVDPMDPMTATVGGVSYDATFARGTGLKEVTITIAKDGETLGTARAIDPRGACLQLYGLCVKEFDMDKRLTLGSATEPTHAFFGESPDRSAVSGSKVYGAIDARETNVRYSATGPVETGRSWSDPARCERFVWLPSESTVGAATINGRTVSGFTSGRSYLIRCGGRATVTGTFTGRITIFSRGGPILKAPIVVTPGSELVVMSDTDGDVQGTGRIDCHFYTSGKLDIPASAGTITWTGSIVAKSITCKTALNLTLDPFFYGDPGSVEDFYLPAN